MAFRVRARRLPEGRVPADLVKATLVVERAAHLREPERTGFPPLTELSTPARVMELLAPGEQLRDALLIAHTNRRRRITDLRGDVLAVTFTYTRCPVPNFCPSMDRHFQSAQRQIQANASLRATVSLLSVSVDPEHDSPAVLAKRAAELQADPATWQFLTGTREEIEQFASPFGVSIIREAGNPEVGHLRTGIIDTEGRLRSALDGDEWTPDELVAELRNARAGH